MYAIDYNSYRSVKGFGRRVRFLVIHFTSRDFKSSATILTGPSVSAHYLVPDPTDQTYRDAGFKDMRIFNLVDESGRAWHAGVSQWAGRNNLNDTSLGIEIVNLANDYDEHVYAPYNLEQIDAVKELAANILQRYPDITPTHIVGHSDIALGRKVGPGPAFPWRDFYTVGIGAWYDESTKQRYRAKFCNALPSKVEVLNKLGQYGYATSNAESEGGYVDVLRAFQLHFRPEKYDGVLDVETVAILYALVEKYFPGK